MSLSRRNFLKVSSTAAGGLLLTLGSPLAPLQAGRKDAEVLFEPNYFLKIDPQGNIHFIVTKHEMGQGSSTGLAMILADELGADWEKVKIEFADYHPQYDGQHQGTTGGSSSIRKLWQPLREAGATAREMLIQAAAQRWQVSVQDCYADLGVIIHQPSGKKLAFGDLVEEATRLEAPKNPSLKDPKDFKYIGQPLKNLRTRDVVQGKATYGINVQLPGMRYAAIARSPVYLGKVKSYDDTQAKAIPGVTHIFKIPSVKGRYSIQEGVVVVADSTWTAFQAKKALKIKWEEGANAQRSLASLRKEFDKASKKEGKVKYETGHVNNAFKAAHQTLEARYENPYQAHACMEPMNATAHVEGNRCEVWAGTQAGSWTTNAIAEQLGIPEKNITTHVMPAGGAFGRRFYPDVPVEAAYISQQIGAPVKLTWTREDDIQHDYFHPLQQDVHQAAISKDKKVTAWKYLGLSVRHGADFWNPYEVPNLQAATLAVNGDEDRLIEVGAWRSVGGHLSALGQECFVDEVAHAIGQDPYQLRLEWLKNDRMLDVGVGFQLDAARYREVMKAVAQKAQWGKKMPKNHGQGLAVYTFLHTSSYCAQIAEVSVEKGVLKIHKITAVLDCGIPVNPQLVKGQIEGSIVWGLTALKYGGIDVEAGKVKQSNFHDYKMLRINELPEIEVHLMDSQMDPKGTGEPGVPPVAPAVLNAIFAASGKRIRKIPVLPEDLA